MATKTVQIQQQQQNKNVVLHSKKQQVVETEDDDDSETEVCRVRDAKLLIDKSLEVISSLEKDLIQANRKNIVYDKIVKDSTLKIKERELKLKLMDQELSHYKDKASNKKIDTILTDHKLTKIFDRKDNYIQQQSAEGIDRLYEQMAKEYGLN